MDELMDSDDEIMFAALVEEEAEIAITNDKELLMMLSCLMALYVRSDAKMHRGGAPGRRKSKPRHRLEGYYILYADYFVDDPLDGEVVFRRRFWMSRKLFLDIVYAVWCFDNYFIWKKDCTGMVGFSSLQKCTAILRMLAY
jgi:hypothetical protein